MASSQLLEETIAAHGGRDRWRAVERIDFSLSSGGFAFLSRSQPFALMNLKASVRPHQRQATLRDFPRPGWRGTWTPDSVRILDAESEVRGERRDPRRHFRGLVNQVYWDKLDILYFAGYALWNYLSFPFLLEEPGVAMTQDNANGAAPRLDAVFDADFPTHSASQTFHLDPSRRLLRHDYAADVIGKWATAAHYCEGGVEAEGFLFYTRRKVFPRLGRNVVARFPTLVWIAIDNLEVLSRRA